MVISLYLFTYLYEYIYADIRWGIFKTIHINGVKLEMILLFVIK